MLDCPYSLGFSTALADRTYSWLAGSAFSLRHLPTSVLVPAVSQLRSSCSCLLPINPNAMHLLRLCFTSYFLVILNHLLAPPVIISATAMGPPSQQYTPSTRVESPLFRKPRPVLMLCAVVEDHGGHPEDNQTHEGGVCPPIRGLSIPTTGW